MKKALKWLAVAHLALIVIPLAVLLLANLRDEELTPAAAAFLQTERSSVPDEQNAFYYLVGFNAPLAEHPHAAGRAWLAAVNAAQEKILAGTEAPWPPQPRGLPKIEALCIPERDSCIRSLKEKDEGRKALAHHAQIVERYRAVHAYRGYFDMLDARLHSYPLPLYLQSSNAQRLFLMDVARRLEGGEIDRALAALRDEIAFTQIGRAHV